MGVSAPRPGVWTLAEVGTGKILGVLLWPKEPKSIAQRGSTMMTGHQQKSDVHSGPNVLPCWGMFGKKKQLGFPQASPGKVETGRTPSPNDPPQVLAGLTHTKNILTMALARSKSQLLPP